MKKSILILSILAVYLLNSCSSNEQKEERQKEAIKEEINDNLSEAKEDIDDAFKNIGEAFEGLKKKHNIEDKEPVNFREIKKILPESLAGFDLEKSEGQTSGAMGFKISTVKAEYEDGDGSFDLEIIDVAGIGALVTGMAAWANFDVDKESDDGYERTTTINGYKAYEKYNQRRERGEINLLIEDRFIISLKGRGVSERQLRQALDDIDIRKLTRLAEE